MKKLILPICALFPLFVSCQNKWQTVSYNGVSVQIPSDWGNKNTVNYYEDYEYTEYQISCWSKNKGMWLTIQWVDVELDGDLYIESMVKTQRERFPMFREIDYSKIVDADFLNMKAKKCHFSKNFDYDDGVEGEYIAFTKDEHSYIVLICGDRKFYKSNNYNTILNNINPNFLGIEQPKEKTVQTSATEDNFTRYEFREYSLSIPNTMELRNENSFMSLGKEIISDKIKSIKKIDIGDCNFVFQPAGTDDVQNSDRQKKALSLYSRVLINYQEGEKYNYMSWNDNTLLTQTEYNQLNKQFKDNLTAENEQAKQASMGIKVISVDDIKIGKNANKFVYIKQSYIRSGLKGNVKVTDYYLFNNSEMVKLTISYRISENNVWEKDFDKILDTFSFNSKK